MKTTRTNAQGVTPWINATQVATRATVGTRPLADVFEINAPARVTFRGGKQRRRLIGVYGGSFDPPTLGHLQCIKHLAGPYRHSQEIGEGPNKRKLARPLDEVWVVPNHLHWKPAKRKGRAPYEDRIKMLELAIANLDDCPKLPMLKQPKPKIRVSRADQEAGGTSHPVKRIRHIAAANPDAQLVIFFGGDMKAEVEKWPDYEALTKLAEVVFLERPGYAGAGTVQLKNTVDVSSTEVRKAIAAGDIDAIRGKVDPDVLRYLEAHPDIQAKYHERHKDELGPAQSAA